MPLLGTGMEPNARYSQRHAAGREDRFARAGSSDVQCEADGASQIGGSTGDGSRLGQSWVAEDRALVSKEKPQIIPNALSRKTIEKAYDPGPVTRPL